MYSPHTFRFYAATKLDMNIMMTRKRIINSNKIGSHRHNMKFKQYWNNRKLFIQHRQTHDMRILKLQLPTRPSTDSSSKDVESSRRVTSEKAHGLIEPMLESNATRASKSHVTITNSARQRIKVDTPGSEIASLTIKGKRNAYIT